MLSHFNMSNSVQPYGQEPARLLCPWDSSGKNTGVGCHALLQGTFLTQGMNLCLFMIPALADEFFATSATNLDTVLNSRDITLPTKVCIVKAVVLP